MIIHYSILAPSELFLLKCFKAQHNTTATMRVGFHTNNVVIVIGVVVVQCPVAAGRWFQVMVRPCALLFVVLPMIIFLL